MVIILSGNQTLHETRGDSPRVLAQVQSAATHFDSPQGSYTVAWDSHAGTIDITVPAGGTAKLVLPPERSAPNQVGPGQHRYHRSLPQRL
ncbi:alpha-L-rhamnosidase C-terminal domain-containing protein [Microbacterium aurum]